jgi:hypothetical protein
MRFLFWLLPTIVPEKIEGVGGSWEIHFWGRMNFKRSRMFLTSLNMVDVKG